MSLGFGMQLQLRIARRCSTCKQLSGERTLPDHTVPKHLPSETPCLAMVAALGYCGTCLGALPSIEWACFECLRVGYCHGSNNGFRALSPSARPDEPPPVPCSNCKAAPGEPCRDPATGDWAPIHGWRLRKARKLNKSASRSVPETEER